MSKAAHHLYAFGPFRLYTGERLLTRDGQSIQLTPKAFDTLELLVEHGIAGLAFYLWLMWEIWRLGRGSVPRGDSNAFLDRDFHNLWPLMLGVYWINAAFVVMNYQFVNGLLFATAGMLAAQRRKLGGSAAARGHRPEPA